MKLYTVEVSVEMVVIAKDEADAERIAKETFESHSVDDLGQESFHAAPMEYIGQLPAGWQADALPFGDDPEGDRAINVILLALTATEAVR